MRFCYQKIEMRRWLCKKIFLFLTAAGNYFFNFWRSRNPPNVEDVIRRLQQAAEPPSSAHFVSCAVAFTLRLKPRKMRGTYTEIARLQPDCNFSVKSRKMSRTHTGISGGFTALKFFSCQGRRSRSGQEKGEWHGYRFFGSSRRCTYGGHMADRGGSAGDH